MNTLAEPTTPEAPMFEVTELDQFVTLLADWHQKQVRTLLHLKDVPEGQEVHVEGEAPLILEGNVRRGFQLGLELALNYLGHLPFEAVSTSSSHVQ